MSNILKILIEPNPILRKRSELVSKKIISHKEFQQLCLDLSQTMVRDDGAGLAAPQIGKNICLIAINIKDGVLIMINPKIVKTSLTKEWGEEGCLSVPDVFGKVKRFKKIKCKFLDKSGKEKNIQAKGMMARVIQHEIDHLDGILFIDKARSLNKQV
ncbi:MAG: peptide deformylase [bacterium]